MSIASCYDTTGRRKMELACICLSFLSGEGRKEKKRNTTWFVCFSFFKESIHKSQWDSLQSLKSHYSCVKLYILQAARTKASICAKYCFIQEVILMCMFPQLLSVELKGSSSIHKLSDFLPTLSKIETTKMKMLGEMPVTMT